MIHLDEFISIVKNNCIRNIYTTGVVLPPDSENDVAEFVPNRSLLFFELGNQLLKFEAIEQYSKILITTVPAFKVKVEVEDAIPVKSVVTDLLLDNSLIDNNISQIEFFILIDSDSEMVCDTLRLSLTSSTNKQELFLDPQFFGINIGGNGVERLWRIAQLEGYHANSTVINFTD
ncbi:hypothetical protein [Paenibacillus typhae]|uniref:Uncharacterized protein n=1 Tax=Paenibacillus typhae TaxID=1174501 RepID=A0A1G8ERJ5_9BACL|nr:hypothetical protein [Paenibacillus typhae]SDH72521.1 hypothetical protein SAMN05216192_1015 [Paenibacillus typhae]